jgi:hypothetical protein
VTEPDPPALPETINSEAGAVIFLPVDGEVLASVDDFVDLIGTAAWGGAAWVAIPCERLTDSFFQLRTGLAGEVAQKFANYRLGLAVFGDITRFTDVSPTLRDLVRESNGGRQLWFVPDRAALDERLRRTTS